MKYNHIKRHKCVCGRKSKVHVGSGDHMYYFCKVCYGKFIRKLKKQNPTWSINSSICLTCAAKEMEAKT
jgi:hypothetical protein